VRRRSCYLKSNNCKKYKPCIPPVFADLVSFHIFERYLIKVFFFPLWYFSACVMNLPFSTSFSLIFSRSSRLFAHSFALVARSLIAIYNVNRSGSQNPLSRDRENRFRSRTYRKRSVPVVFSELRGRVNFTFSRTCAYSIWISNFDPLKIYLLWKFNVN